MSWRVGSARGERGGAHRLPILGITANTAPEDLNLCRDAGMDDSLVKPTRLATLRDYLSRWFGTDSAWQAAPAESPSARRRFPGRIARGDAEPFVPVDLWHMTQLWGSESTVKALLDSFVSSVREDIQALPPLLDSAEIEASARVASPRGGGGERVAISAAAQRTRGIPPAILRSKTPERLRSDGAGAGAQMQCDAGRHRGAGGVARVACRAERRLRAGCERLRGEPTRRAKRRRKKRGRSRVKDLETSLDEGVTSRRWKHNRDGPKDSLQNAQLTV